VAEVQHAKKETILAEDAIKLARSMTHVFAAKGKKVVRLNVKKDQPGDEEIRKLIVGPSGNLRAPSLRIGKKLVVGFHPDMYADVLPG
jgi:arsenate reductase-like glutaredoxin family protein